MKLERKDLHIIRSLANDLLRETPKNKELDADEFVALCWIKAVSNRLDLNLTVDLPTRLTKPKE